MKYLKKFMISETQFLIINPESIDSNECEVCAEINIDYVDDLNNFCIKFGNEALSDFCYKILESGRVQKLIDGEMRLDDSIVDDLGFEWNQSFNGIRGPTEVSKYHFCSNSHKQVRPYFSSWLYNDKDGNVVFEITPFYPWHGKTKKTNPEKISYKEWIKTYKRILKTTIPKESLKQWIVQAKELEKIYFPEFQKS